MRSKSNFLRPVVSYPALLGQVIAKERTRLGINQGTMASTLGISQSAYSRLEAGSSVLNVSQLHNVAAILRQAPAQLVDQADRVEMALRQQGADITTSKEADPAAAAIGLGLLAALLIAASR